MKKKIDYTKLTRHKASAMFPNQSAAEFAELRASIKKDGLKTPILITAKGEVIDGWHRYTALQALKVKLAADMFRVDDTSDPVALSWSLQLGRRNLSDEQRCALIVLSGGDDTARVRQHVGLKYWGDCLALKAAGEDNRLAAIAAGKSYVAVEMTAAGLREKKARAVSAPAAPPASRAFLAPKVERKVMTSFGPRGSSLNGGRRHFVIPDTQVSPGVPLVHFKWLAKYAAAKRPDVIIHLGDHYDLHALSSYDEGTTAAENQRLESDLAAGREALDLFNKTLAEEAPGYTPEMHILTGNHENRLARLIKETPKLADSFNEENTFDRARRGWEVHPFLEPIDIDGVRYAHYFVRNTHGQVVQSVRGMPSAREQVKREGMSSVSGHKQSLDMHIQGYQNKLQIGVIAGSCYLHDEGYLSPQGHNYWRGALMLNGVVGGEFSPWAIDLDWFCRRYEGIGLQEFCTANATNDKALMTALRYDDDNGESRIALQYKDAK